MASEGEFPKVDGDLLYASEINRMNPKLISFIEDHTNKDIGSHTWVTRQTLSYNAGSVQISDYFYIISDIFFRGGGINTFSDRILISGPGLNNMLIKSQSADGIQSMNFHVVVTSGALTASGGNIGSNYDFKIQTQHPSTEVFVLGDSMLFGV